MTKYTKDTNQLPTDVVVDAESVQYMVGQGVLETPALWEEYGLVELPEPNNTKANDDVLFADKDENGQWFCEWHDSSYYTQQASTRTLDGKMRVVRNLLLRDSDWTQVADAPFTPEQRQLWIDYRQALRDLPNQEGYPQTAVWPQRP